MIAINNVAMSYGSKLLFTEVNLNLVKGKRYGLVGANGAGKTTFLRVLMGEEEQVDGEITVAKQSKVGWLRQDQFRFEDTSIINVVIAGNVPLWDAMQEKEELLAKADFDDEAGYRYAELEQVILDNDGYTAEVFAAELLIGLGVKEEYHYQPLSVLSGGYKLRVLLAQSLFNNPDILLLDEPTNHLDIITIYWLENYLRDKFKGVLLFISHDLAFLNNLSTHILDIDYGEIRQYTGNYDDFVTQKVAVEEQKLRERSHSERKIDKMQAFVDRFRASATRAKQAQSRIKMIDKIELPDIHKSSRISPHFDFKQKKQSNKVVLKANDIAKTYSDRKLFNKVSFNLMRGEKLLVIGPNGVGKSTLLKILLGLVEPEHGTVEWGEECNISYFAQDHHEELNENINLLDWLTKKVEHEQIAKIRAILGQMLFRQDDVYKNILDLSGGEGARLLLAKIMLEEKNVLVFDEPTNHMDIETKEALRKALKAYPGTLITVSHDRSFAGGVANRIIAITPKGIIDYMGSYKDYLKKYGHDYLLTGK